MKRTRWIPILAGAMLCISACIEKPITDQTKPLPAREIALKSRTFTPTAGIPKDLEERYKKQSENQQLQDGRVHLLAQFNRVIEPSSDRKRLAADGIDLLEPIGPSAWYISVDKDKLSRLSEDKNLLWADLIQVKDKLDPELEKTPVPYEHQKRQGDRAAYTIMFHKDISPEQVTTLEKQFELRFESFDARAFRVIRTAVVEIPSGRLQDLAALDIICWIEPSPGMDTNDNLANAQPLSNVDDVQGVPFNLNGNGINVGVWEFGSTVYAAHLDLTPRVAVQPGQLGIVFDHASHVAGTIGASGVNVPGAEGMAPLVSMLSWDSQNDQAEMTVASTPPGPGLPPAVDISNHSYGFVLGWNGAGNQFTNNQAQFGTYNATSQGWDAIIAASNLIVCKSAGNDRNDAWDGVTAIPGFPAGTAPPNDCFQSGFPGGAAGDCMEQRACAKNVITVGAMNGGAAIAAFSNYGPTNDGRIKPDIVAQGVGMLSTASNVFDDGNGDGIDDAPNTNTSSTQMSGTSMSTPTVAGICALILQEADSLGDTITTAGMKALLCQSASDVAGIGQATVGPDYATGYGIADAEAAINLLRQGGLAMDTLTATGPAGAWTRTIFVPAGLPELKVTLAWSDPAGNPAAAIALVNDLDITLTPPGGGAARTPWGLNPANPAVAAVRNNGRDAINNVEQVSVLNPAAGTWTITVSALPGALPGGIQSFGVAGVLPNSDVVLVMDKSGSMILDSGTPGVSKIDALKTAANEFIDLLDLTGGHNLGLVQFDEAVQAFVPPFNLQALNAGSLAAAHNAINSLNADGMTNIISGVQAADAQLSAAATPSPRQSIVVFSDGKHNRPIGSSLTDIGPIVAAGGYNFYSIGFGTDVDDAILNQVAIANRGIHVNEQDLSALQLTKYFLTVGALVHDLSVLSDPPFVVGAGESAELKVDAISGDNSLIFAINWTGAAPDMDVMLVGPNKECRIPIKSGNGVEVRRGDRYVLVKVVLPFKCSGREMGPGAWTLRATPKGLSPDAKETVDIMVLGSTPTKFIARTRTDKLNGTQIAATLRFPKTIKMAIERTEIQAILTLPLPPTGDSEKQDRRTQKQLDQTPREKRIKTLTLLDDGKNGDGKAKDGIYTARIPAISQPGIVQARVVGRFSANGATFTREATTSFYVK